MQSVMKVAHVCHLVTGLHQAGKCFLFDDGHVVVVGVAAAYTLLRERLRNLTPIGAASEVCLLVTLLVLEPLNKWKQR